MAETLLRSAAAVTPGSNFPFIKRFYWSSIEAGEWLLLKLHCAQVPFIVRVVENSLGRADGPTMTVHLGDKKSPTTIRLEDIKSLKRYTGLLPGYAR